MSQLATNEVLSDEAPIILPKFTTFITTVSYIPGVVCLAKSLQLFEVRVPVLVVYTNNDVKIELEKHDIINVIEIKLLPLTNTRTPKNCTLTHNGVGALLHVDSPRRILFKTGKPFIYLDADLLCVNNPVSAFASIFKKLKKSNMTLAACTAFRLKKKKYNETNEKGFNAGVIVCLGCSEEDNKKIDIEIEKAMEITINDPCNANTEERILSDVFRKRYLLLDPKFNLIKRVYKYNPILWNDIVKQEALFVHYMGAKPWQKSIDEKKLCDWDYDGYDILEEFWNMVYNNDFSTAQDLKHAFTALKNPYMSSVVVPVGTDTI